MPLVHISLREGKPPAHLRAIADGVYETMLSTINVPAGDRFQVITEHVPKENWSFGNGIAQYAG